MMFMILLLIPAIVLLWRVVVSKQRWAVRAGAATGAMLTVVGSVTMPRLDLFNVAGYHLTSVRDAIALLAATSGPIYLLLWSRKHRGRGRSKTISIIAAIVGLVPIVAAVGVAIFFPGEL
jgi:hypothetical protein